MLFDLRFERKAERTRGEGGEKGKVLGDGRVGG